MVGVATTGCGLFNDLNLSGTRYFTGFFALVYIAYYAYCFSHIKVDKMQKSPSGVAIPTSLPLDIFEQFVFPHLSFGSRGPSIKITGTVQKGPVLGTSRRVYAHWNSVLVTWKFIKGIEC